MSGPFITPRQHQIDAMRFADNNGMQGTLLWHQMGLGKAQPLDAIVYTPDGPVKMGSIKAGEFVFNADGTPVRVLGVFPQGKKDVYRVEFSDGSITHCCDEHLWNVQTPQQRFEGKGFITKSLEQIRENLYMPDGSSRWHIPMARPVCFNKRHLRIPPYLMGVMIGDGSLKHGTSITNASDYIYSRLVKDIKQSGLDVDIRRKEVKRDSTYAISIVRKSLSGINQVRDIIIDYGLNVNSTDKHIPDDYKYSDIEDRTNILNGLLDTDGYVARDGCVQYTSASKQLCQDVAEIVQSLGGTASIKHKKTNIATDAWTATIKMPNDLIELVVTKPFKRARIRKFKKYPPRRLIRRVDYIGVQDCQCISVEGQLYLTDSFIVTHNTLTALWHARDHIKKLKIQGLSVTPKVAIICPKSAIMTWREEIRDNVPELKSETLVYAVSSIHHLMVTAKYHDIRYLIIDESHALKSPSTNRVNILAKLFYQLGKMQSGFRNGRIALLTGTPMPNGAHELYTSWAICAAPDIIEASKRLTDAARFKMWKDTYAGQKQVKFDKYNRSARKKVKVTRSRPEGVNNVEQLGQLMAKFTHYRRAIDCIDLPQYHEKYIDLGLPDDRLLADAKIEEPEAYMAVIERLSRAKTPHMLGWIQEFMRLNPSTQLLVFAMHRNPLDEMVNYFGGQTVKIITGRESRQEREAAITSFKAGFFPVIGMTYKCGSESLNLQNAYNSLYHGYPWTDSTLRQAMARTYRSGQKRETYHYFLTSGHNDAKILRLVRAKQEATNQVEDELIMLERQATAPNDLMSII